MRTRQKGSMRSIRKADGCEGRSCVHFRKLDDLPFALIGKPSASLPLDDFVRDVKEIHSPRKGKKS